MHSFKILLWAAALCPVALAAPAKQPTNLWESVQWSYKNRGETLTPAQLEALKKNPCAYRPISLCYCDDGSFNDGLLTLCGWNEGWMPKCSACLKALEDAGISTDP